MEFRILGPLEVVDGDRRVGRDRGKPRALLAVLLLHVNEVVTSERLIDELWGEAPPATAAKSVQVYVSRLRRALGADGSEGVLRTRAGGYVLQLGRDQLDVDRFERLLAAGREALEAHEPARAAETLRDALALWRGPPLVDFAYEPFAQSEIARLEEVRLTALEERIEAELALGRHARLVGELETLVVEHPLRERWRGQLMVALYRCGRQAEALEVYREGRRRLVEELGLEPSPALQRLEQAILAQSAELEVAPAAPSARAGALRHRGLPAPPNRTIGRAGELTAIGERLRDESVRMLTLVGPGGVGKTRLALEAARAVEADFADGASFVSLAALRRSDDVPGAIATALGRERALGRIAPARDRARPGHQAPAAGRRQLRASPGRGAVRRRTAGCLPQAHGARHEPRTAAPAGGGALSRRAARPAHGRGAPGRGPAGGRRRPRAVRRAREATTPTSISTRATSPRSRRSAAASTGSRSPSSSRPPAAGCCPLRRSPLAWTPRSAPAHATRPRASRHCARPSTGATSCSARTRRSALRASPCSSAAGRSRRRRR